jgi:hypothetical protein
MVYRAKLEPAHPLDDLPIQVFQMKRFTVQQVIIRWAAKPTDHP